MPVAARIDGTCPNCDYSGDVWTFEKRTGGVHRECYTCPACGGEWAVTTN